MTPTTLPCSAGAVQSYHSNFGLREGKSVKRTSQTGPCLVSLARSYHKGKTSRLGFCKYNLPWVRKVGGRQFVVGVSKCAYTAAVETEEAVDGASALDGATAVDGAPALSPEDEKLETDTGIEETPDNGDQANKKRAPRRPVRKITVKNEELIVGSVFTGIVKSIQPWGAFINIGAFADGLVHISKAGEGFVRNMEDVVKIGQEVKVKVIEVDMEQRRIKLSIKDVEKEGQIEPVTERASSRWGTGETATQRPRVQGRGSQVRQPAKQKATTKFQKGQTVTGVVKNLTRRGGFVQLPGGEEGFLHSAEITPGGEDLPIENLLQVGQEVSVRILRITEGRLNLSMKTEVDLKKMNAAINDNEEAWATNAFELAFRKNPVIKQYLDETKKNNNTAETTEKVDGDVDEAGSSSMQTLEIENKEILVETSADEKLVELSDVTEIPPLESAQESQKIEESVNSSDGERLLEDSGRIVNTTMTEEESPEVDQSVDDDVHGKNETQEADIENALELGEVESGNAILSDDKSKQPDTAVSEISAKLDEADEIGGRDSGPAVELSERTQTEEDKAKKGVDSAVSESSTQLDEAAKKLSATATAVSAALVKQLREETGAGMMDCKRALTETGGDIEHAYEYLRKKGLAGAEKKASRLASEGAVGSYIHDGRIGVLLEVNCETDFVSRGEIFKQLVDDLSMQIAANQQVAYVAVEDIPQELKDKEWAIEMEREDLQTKPEQIRAKIVEGRITKRLGDLALLEQPFIKDDNVLVKDLIKQTVVTVGENIRIRRFARFVLGEGLEKREHDFAAEVAAQTKPKESIQGTSVEVKTDAAKGTIDEGSAEIANGGPSDVVISAAMVKQLREETGTGMMDCKKALLDSGGDYEKAREYLRKKGLASADKKASRIAAEGAVGSYIHDSRIGVLIEVNSETDFVARGEIFKQLLEDLAMQVVANPQVQFISVDDIPSDVRQKERELEMQREDLQSKPEQIREKIVDGRMSKRLGDLCLLEQPFIKDDSILVRDLIKQTIASIGENIKVRRFVRFTLGEGLEKKSQNFAAEVAAQIKG